MKEDSPSATLTALKLYWRDAVILIAGTCAGIHALIKEGGDSLSLIVCLLYVLPAALALYIKHNTVRQLTAVCVMNIAGWIVLSAGYAVTVYPPLQYAGDAFPAYISIIMAMMLSGYAGNVVCGAITVIACIAVMYTVPPTTLILAPAFAVVFYGTAMPSLIGRVSVMAGYAFMAYKYYYTYGSDSHIVQSLAQAGLCGVIGSIDHFRKMIIEQVRFKPRDYLWYQATLLYIFAILMLCSPGWNYFYMPAMLLYVAGHMFYCTVFAWRKNAGGLALVNLLNFCVLLAAGILHPQAKPLLESFITPFTSH